MFSLSESDVKGPVATITGFSPLVLAGKWFLLKYYTLIFTFVAKIIPVSAEEVGSQFTGTVLFSAKLQKTLIMTFVLEWILLTL